MDDALHSGNNVMVNKLYETALSMPIRMRCAPTFVQVVKDTLTYSEDLFNNKDAGSDAWIDVVPKGRAMLEAAIGANYKTASVKKRWKMSSRRQGSNSMASRSGNKASEHFKQLIGTRKTKTSGALSRVWKPSPSS